MKRNILAASILALAMVLVLAGCPTPITPVGPATGGIASDVTAPVKGTVIVASATTNNSTTLTWGAATDNASPATALSYKLVEAATTAPIDTLAEVVDAKTGIILNWTTGIVSVSVSGLTASTAYCFAVAVRDLSGNTAFYTPITVTTLAPPASAITVDGARSEAEYDVAATPIFDGDGTQWGATLGRMATYSDGNDLCVQFNFSTVGGGNNVFVLLDNTNVATGQEDFTTDFTTGWGPFADADAPIDNLIHFNADMVLWGWRAGDGAFSYSGANTINGSTGTNVQGSVEFDLSADYSGYEFRIPYSAIGESGDFVRAVVLFGVTQSPSGDTWRQFASSLPGQPGTVSDAPVSAIVNAVPVTLE